MAKRRIKKPVRKNKSDYPGEMSFRKALGMNPTYYQEGGKLYYQEDTGELPTVKYGTPEYEQAYNQGTLTTRLSGDPEDFVRAKTLPEVAIIAETPQWIKDKKTKTPDKIDFWESLNYKKWGLNDYSDYSSFNTAFRNSREAKEKEFVYKGKRFNTNLIPKEESDLYHESKKFLSDYYKNNDYKVFNSSLLPYEIKEQYIKNKYGTTWSEYYDQIKDSDDYKPGSKNFDKIQQRLNKLSPGNIDVDNDEDYKLFLDNHLKEEKEKQRQIELNNLEEPYYFSITNQKPISLDSDGYLDGKNKKMFLTTNADPGKLNTTYVHELSHKADDYSVYSRVPEIDVDYINKPENRRIYPLGQEQFEYLSDPSEIEARKMSLLFYAYKNNIDITKMNDSEFNKFYRDNVDKFPYDILQLFDLYSFQKEDLLKYIKNDFSYLKKEKTKKQLGGSLPKAQKRFGGKLYYQQDNSQIPPSTGFNFSGYLDGNQGLIPDYNNIPTKSHISNILFNTPLPVVKPADKPKKSDVLDLDNSLDYLVNTRGGTRDLWGRMADTIGYHESAHTMNPLQKQIGGGPGRGIFQFEAPSLVTAQNRYKRIASKLNLKTDPEILNAKSALELSPEQQYSLFLINLSESKAKLKDYADNKLPLVDLWLQGHKNKEAITDRESFRTSVQKAKKESIKNGYSTLKEFGGKLRYARGGSLTSAQDTAQAADLNQDVMRKDKKKASVGEDFLAGLYGVGKGLSDTLSFGLSDELTDAGFKALQAAAGHDINSDEAKRQAGIAGWGNVAGAVTGAIINPGAIGSAAEEGLEGIGTGIEGIDPNSGIATGIGTSLKGMGSSKMLSGLNDKDKIPQGMQGFSKLFMARNGGRFRYGYQGGGHMVNQNMGLTEIDGPSHEEGGVTLPNSGGRPDVEVEGPETIYTPENYVMSEKMKASKEALEYAGITGKAASRLAGKSYADLSKSIKSKAGDKLRPADPLSKKMLDKEMKRLMMAHEYDREVKRMKDEAMRSQMMGGSNIVAETPEERAGGYNMYPNAESIAFPGSGPTSVVPTYNNDPIMVTGADGSQQMLTDEPIETEAPFIEEKMAQGGKMIKRADGSYSRRGLWDNIRANRGSGRKPTKQMLEQEAKIKAAEKAYGGYYADGGSFDNPGFRALPDYVQAKIKSNMALGGFMGDYIDEDDTMEYGSGGYTVRRSNDRKGKTHVVTGPDGTKKYFGDPKLGERGKSKYGKDAFYARHKKNLAKNPYFRAYARATWEDGGYMNMLDSNVDMVDMETPMYEYGGSMMYGQGGGIHIDPSKRGTFKAQASRMGMGVQEAARTILNAPEGKYSPAMRKKANFARNFAKADGGYMYQMGGEMMPEEMMAAEQQAAMQQGQQPQGGGQEQIIQAIVQMLQQGLQPEQIVGELVKMGIPQEAAIQVVQMVMQQVQQSQGMQQQQQAAPPFEQGMMGQQQGAPAPATMRGGGRMYQMGGSLADTYLQNLNKPKPLFRNGGKLYYQKGGFYPDTTSTLENILNDNTIESGVYQGNDAIDIGKQANANANANTGIKPILFPRPSLKGIAIYAGGVNPQGSMPSVNNRFNPKFTMTPQEKTNWLNKTRGYSGLLPDEGYAAINQFENTMGTYDAQGNPIGMGRGDQYAQTADKDKIETFIDSSIGRDTWDRLPDDVKTQMYSFMFNTGKYDAALSGLAQAINNSTGGGDLGDERRGYTRDFSVNAIKDADFSNPNLYSNYVNVLGDQYNSIADNTRKYNTGVGANYAPTLRNRPISIHNNLYPSGYSFPSSTSAQSATVVPQAAVAPTVTQPNAGTGVLLNPTQIALRNFNQARPSSTPAGKPEKYQQWQPNTAPIVAGGLSAGITPIANLVASITGRDTRAAAPLKFEKPDYTPVAIQRAAANQALANTREAFRRGSPTQGNYLSNLAVTAPSLAANVGREIAGKRFEIGKSRAEIDMREQAANDIIGRFNIMNQGRDQAAREQLRLAAAKGFSTIGQGVTKDLGETLYEANILRNLETKDFSPFNYIKDEKGRFKQVLSPRGAALYRDNTTNNQIVRDNQGNKYMILPGGKIQLIQE